MKDIVNDDTKTKEIKLQQLNQIKQNVISISALEFANLCITYVNMDKKY